MIVIYQSITKISIFHQNLFHFLLYYQSGFCGIGAPHFKLMYELSAPDPAKCAPGLAKCAPGLAKCAPSHKWNVPRHTWVFFVLLEIIELDEKDYGFQLCSWSALVNFLHTWSSLRVALCLSWAPSGTPGNFLCPWECFVLLGIFLCHWEIFAPLDIFCTPGIFLRPWGAPDCAPGNLLRTWGAPGGAPGQFLRTWGAPGAPYWSFSAPHFWVKKATDSRLDTY